MRILLTVAWILFFCSHAFSQMFFHSPGKISDKYDLHPHELGRGNFGTVYLATNKKTNQEVAVKIIAVNPETYLRVNSEVLILRYLTSIAPHAHIVSYVESFFHEVSERRGMIYLVMERLHGEDFFDYVADNLLTESDLLNFTHQLIAMLSHLKMMGVVHRDFKLENINLTCDQHGNHKLVLLDFGMAKFFNEVQRIDNENCGSLHYVPPEIFADDSVCDLSKRDAFALGVALYTIVDGDFPWRTTVSPHRGEIYSQAVINEIAKLKYQQIAPIVGNKTHNAVAQYIHKLLSFAEVRCDINDADPLLLPFNQAKEPQFSKPTRVNLSAMRFLFDYIQIGELQVDAQLTFRRILKNTSHFVTYFYHFLDKEFPDGPFVEVQDIKTRSKHTSLPAYQIVKSDIAALPNAS